MMLTELCLLLQDAYMQDQASSQRQNLRSVLIQTQFQFMGRCQIIQFDNVY